MKKIKTPKSKTVIFIQWDQFSTSKCLQKHYFLQCASSDELLMLSFTFKMLYQVTCIAGRCWCSSLDIFTGHSLQSTLFWLPSLIMKYIRIFVNPSRHQLIGTTTYTIRTAVVRSLNTVIMNMNVMNYWAFEKITHFELSEMNTVKCIHTESNVYIHPRSILFH